MDFIKKPKIKVIKTDKKVGFFDKFKKKNENKSVSQNLIFLYNFFILLSFFLWNTKKRESIKIDEEEEEQLTMFGPPNDSYIVVQEIIKNNYDKDLMHISSFGTFIKQALEDFLYHDDCKLKKLKFSKSDFPEMVKFLISTLSKNRSIEELHLEKVQLNGIEFLIEYLQKCQTSALKILVVNDCDLKKEHQKDFAEILRCNQFLQICEVSNTNKEEWDLKKYNHSFIYINQPHNVSPQFLLIQNQHLKEASMGNRNELTLFHRNLPLMYPKGLWGMKNLTQLTLGCCNLDSIPKGIKNLTELFYLDLSNNKISNLPHELRFLKKMRNLYLQNNKLVEFGESILYMDLLEVLDLSFNLISVWPETIASLKNIKKIHFSDNLAIKNSSELDDKTIFDKLSVSLEERKIRRSMNVKKKDFFFFFIMLFFFFYPS